MTRSTFELIGPHQERPSSFVEVWEHADWRMKMFGVSFEGDRVRPELFDAAKALAAEALPRPAVDRSRYGVGFVVVHDGRGGNWVLVDWWANDNELNQVLFQSDDVSPLDFDRVASELIACVHEMKVVVHEYRAWLATVLENPAGPDLDAYLATVDL